MGDGPQTVFWCGALSFITGYVASRYPNARYLHLVLIVAAAALALCLICLNSR